MHRSISSSEYGSGSYASSVSSSVSKRSQRHEPLNVSGIIKNSAYVQSNPGASFPQDDPDLDEVVLYDDDQNSWSTEDRYVIIYNSFCARAFHVLRDGRFQNRFIVLSIIVSIVI